MRANTAVRIAVRTSWVFETQRICPESRSFRFSPPCGSFASRGLPLAVREPSTTQLFEPSASLRALLIRKS